MAGLVFKTVCTFIFSFIVLFRALHSQVIPVPCVDMYPVRCPRWRHACTRNQYVFTLCHKTCNPDQCQHSEAWHADPIGTGTCTTVDLSHSARQNFLEGTFDFAWDLYATSRRLDDRRGRQKNIFLSPTSISLAVGMVLAGANGETREEIVRSARLTEVTDDELNSAHAWLMQQINGGRTEYQLHTANSIYIQKTSRLLGSYSETVFECFRSNAQLRDFRNKYEPIRLEINQWVEDQTSNKIKDLLPQGSISLDTEMVLVNAIYFKGDWLRPFTTENEAQTSEGRFFPVPNHNHRGPRANVQMMSMKNKFLYSNFDSEFQVLGIRYKGTELTMFIFLPKSRPLHQLENGLSGGRLTRMMSAVQERTVDVTIPKFKLTRDLKLRDILKSLGMLQMWQNSADFSGITGRRDLKIDDAFHKAFIEVNEKGTEAAAATGFIVVATSALINPDPVFRADHPFLFLIRHDASNTILFMGSLYDVPEQ